MMPPKHFFINREALKMCILSKDQEAAPSENLCPFCHSPIENIARYAIHLKQCKGESCGKMFVVKVEIK